MKKLPDGWHEVTIEDIASVDSGQGAPQGDKWYNGEKIFIKAGDLNNLTEGKYVGDYCQRISNEAISHHNLKEYPANSIVFPKSGMSVKTDNIALLKYDSYVVNHLAIVKVNEDLCSEKYLYYLFKGKKISNLSLNDSYPSIRLQDIKNFKALLPPLPTQKKIAAVLEKAEKLREWRKEADGLTDKFLKSTFLEMFGDIGKNENGWNEKLLKDCIEIPLNSGLSPICSDVIGGIPVFSLANLTDHGLINNMTKYYYGDQLNKGFDLEIGDILISRSNTKELVGRVGLYKGIPEKVIYPDLMIRIRLDREVLNPIFFEEYLRTDIMRESIQQFAHGTSGSMVKISQKNLMDLQLIIPPIELQQKFASIVQQVEQVRQYQKESRQQIDHFFNVLMQKAFNGELEA